MCVCVFVNERTDELIRLDSTLLEVSVIRGDFAIEALAV